MENKKDISFCMNNSSHSQVKSSVPLPRATDLLARVKEQVEFQCFARREKNARGEERWVTEPIYTELCLMIAEVLALPPDAKIKVAGMELAASFVQEVFLSINNDNVETVVHNFKQVTYEVKHKKTYLRTALYNTVFEEDISLVNDLASTMPGFYDRRGGQ